MQYSYDNIIIGDLANIGQVVKEILHNVQPYLNEDEIFDLRLVLNELLINCHEHGNKKDCKKSIYLKCTANEEEVNISVQDEGEGFDGLPCYNVEEYRSDGRGLLLIKSLVDKIEINKNKVNCKMLIDTKKK